MLRSTSRAFSVGSRSISVRPHPCPQHQTRLAAQRRNISAYGYEQAKALVYSEHGEPKDVLRLHSHSISPPHSNLSTVRFLASPINPADINTIQGTYPSRPPFTSSLSSSTPIAVPGNEGVAEVTSTGSSSHDFFGQKLSKGDWVIMRSAGCGTWRTHAQAPGDQFVKIDEKEREGVSRINVGTISVNPCTAWGMLKGYVGGGNGSDSGGDAPPGRAVQEGEWFIQNGSNSGVGRAAIQLGREWGLKSINIIRSRPDSETATQSLKDELTSLGANVVLTEEEASSKTFPDQIKTHTNNGREKISLALNCVGGRSALNLAKVVSENSWLVTYGAMAKQPLSVPAGMLIFKDLRFGGFWVSKWGDRYVQEKRRAISEVLGLIREGRFRDVPVEEVRWEWGSKEEDLRGAVEGALEGFRKGKGVFVFGET